MFDKFIAKPPLVWNFEKSRPLCHGDVLHNGEVYKDDDVIYLDGIYYSHYTNYIPSYKKSYLCFVCNSFIGKTTINEEIAVNNYIVSMYGCSGNIEVELYDNFLRISMKVKGRPKKIIPSKIEDFRKFLNSKGYALDYEDGLWSEDWVTEHSYRDIFALFLDFKKEFP